MTPQRVLSFVTASAIVVTIAAIGVFQRLPPNKLHIVPSSRWTFATAFPPTADQLAGGYWTEDNTRFTCTMPERDTHRYVCAVDILLQGNIIPGESILKGYDLSNYKSLVIDAQHEGSAPKMRIYLRNYNDAYAVPEDSNSAKIMVLSLNTRELHDEQPVTIFLKEFSVPDWWTEQRDLAREFLPLEFNNVILLGFEFSGYPNDADYLSIKFNELYFEGPRINESTFYRTLLLTWVACAIIFLVSQFIALIARTRKYSRQLRLLAADKDYFERQSHKYKMLSHLDALTGVLNRLGLQQSLQKLRADPSNFPASVIVLDIDHFKRINDTRGHDVGDLILRDICQLVNNNIRATDLLARWGGEEFVLIVPKANASIGYTLTEKIRSVIAAHEFHHGKPLQVTCSFGIADLAFNETFEGAFKRADNALFQAKREGRNCSVVSGELHHPTRP